MSPTDATCVAGISQAAEAAGVGDLSSTTIIHALDNQRVMTITGASVYLAEVRLTGGVVTTSVYNSDCGADLQVKFAVVQLVNVSLAGGTATCGGGLGVMTAGV